MTNLNFSLQQQAGDAANTTDNTYNDGQPIPKYKPAYQLRHTQPTRATCFHPSGQTYVVGSNSRVLSICHYPSQGIIDKLADKDVSSLTIEDEPVDRSERYSIEDEYRLERSYEDSQPGRLQLPLEPKIAFKFINVHRGSIYCAQFNHSGDLLATGSNDQSVNIIRYNSTKHEPVGDESRLCMHKGTVRDLCFMQGEKGHHLLTAGAGDNEIYVSDCNTMKPVLALEGHQSTVMSLHNWGSPTAFVSGSLDGSVKMWDLRLRNCVATIKKLDPSLSENNHRTPMRVNGQMTNGNHQELNGCQQVVESGQEEEFSSSVGVVRVDLTGRLLVSGHMDGNCMLYDIRGKRIVQSFQAHEKEIRTLNFSPKSYYLLTGSYDCKVKLMDLQGDLTKPLPTVEIAELDDRVVQTAWHPRDYNFVTTCAGGSATLWLTKVTSA